MIQKRVLIAAVFGFVVLMSFKTLAQDESLRYGLSIESDVRYIVETSRGTESGDGLRFDWNRNMVSAEIDVFVGERTHGRVSGKFVFYGFGQQQTLEDLTDRETLDPYWFELNEAYLEVRGVFTDTLDMRIGRQVLTWGSADVFNPTDLLCPRDFSDPLDYAAKLPTTMLRLDWYPTDTIHVTAALVPFFKPARLPASAILGLLSLESVPIRNRSEVEKLQALQSMLSDPSVINIRTHLVEPEMTIENMQAGARAQFALGEVDAAISYYYGRFGFPQPLAIKVEPPADVDAYLYYPRLHMIGADFSASISALWDVGIFGEAALYLPEKIIFAMQLPDAIAQQAGVSNPLVSTNVEGRPFVKATGGFDYSFGSHVYLNVQYIYGFLDEFDDLAGLRHYVAPDLDLKFLDETLLIRLAGIFCFTDNSFSLNPLISYAAADGVEILVGGLIFVGDTKRSDPLDYGSFDKFGQKAAGRSVVFLKARLSI